MFLAISLESKEWINPSIIFFCGTVPSLLKTFKFRPRLPPDLNSRIQRAPLVALLFGSRSQGLYTLMDNKFTIYNSHLLSSITLQNNMPQFQIELENRPLTYAWLTCIGYY